MVYLDKVENKLSNFILRLISASILAPLVIVIISASGYYFLGMILLAAIIMGGEWAQMTAQKNTLWKIAGIPYILLPCLALIWIINQNSLEHNLIKFSGSNTVISIFILVWANDIGGYVCGRIFAGKKLAPSISPSKTWSGFFGGVAFAMAVSPMIQENIMFAGLTAMIASVGDLLESWIKRRCKVKDSGSLIPGHGGILDRVDGILMVASVVGLLALCVQ